MHPNIPHLSHPTFLPSPVFSPNPTHPPSNRRTYSYSEPQLYSQNSGGSYFDTQGSSAQVSTVVTSHGMTNNGGGAGGGGGMSMNMAGGQVISGSPGGAYIMDNAGSHPATQSTRASPATVSPPDPLWLRLLFSAHSALACMLPFVLFI